MTTIPTEQELRRDAEQMISKHPEYKICGNCAHRNPLLNKCEVTGMRTYPNIPANLCRHYITDYEMIVKDAKKTLENDKLALDKIDNLLAISVTTANSVTCFLADLEKRIKSVRKEATNEDAKRFLKKDLDMTEEIKKGMEMIGEELIAMSDVMQGHIDKIDNFYQWYIQPHLNRMFSKDGVFDKFKTDGHLNNSMDFCRLIIDFVIAVIGNETNYDQVFLMLRTMVNDQPYSLTHKDSDHYKLKDK